MPSPSDSADARRRPHVRRLRLKDFRSYASLDVAFEGSLIALTGENGAGKTNLIEALSLFSPGRGLRRAELSEFPRVGGAGGFAISIEVEDDGERRHFGVGAEVNGSGALERQIRIDREEVLARIQNENIEAGAAGVESSWAAYAARRANRQAAPRRHTEAADERDQSRHEDSLVTQS